MPGRTHTRTGQNACPAHNAGADRRPRKKQPSRTDGSPRGAFGTPLLTLRTGKGGVRLRNFNPDILCDDLKDRRTRQILLESARNYAKQYGFQLKTNRLSDTLSVSRLIGELRNKGGETVKLYKDEDGHLRLGHGRLFSEECETYFIRIGPTWKTNPETGLLIRRFIRAFDKRFMLGDITEQGYYEWLKDCNESNLEYANEHPGEFTQAEIASFDCFDDYYPEGPKKKLLKEYQDCIPATRAEIEAFVPATKNEENLKGLMLRGFALIESDLDIWKWSSETHPFSDDDDESYQEGFIPFESICTIILDYDDMVEQYIQMIENDYESGMRTECLANIEEITPSGKLEKGDLIREFVSVVLHLDLAIGELPTTKTTEETTCQ